MYVESNYWAIRPLSIIGSARGDDAPRATADPHHLFARATVDAFGWLCGFALPSFNPETARLCRKGDGFARIPLYVYAVVDSTEPAGVRKFRGSQEDDDDRQDRRYQSRKNGNGRIVRDVDFVKGTSQ